MATRSLIALVFLVGVSSLAHANPVPELRHREEGRAFDLDDSPALTDNTPAVPVCDDLLAKEQAKYKPIGFVSSSLVNKLTKERPILFTEIYFRALGEALRRQGFDRMVNAKGVFLENMTENDKARALNIVSGTSERNIQIQCLVARAIWDVLVDAFHLHEANIPMEKMALYAKQAYYTNIDDYVDTHDFLLANLGQKRQIIEFLRLSLPFGVRMALDGLDKSDRKAVFLTGLSATAVSMATYVGSMAGLMIGAPAPGEALPILIAIGSAAAVGTRVYLYNAPRSRLQRVHHWIMNRNNIRVLKKQGLISDRDGESSALVHAIFEDLVPIQNEVSLKDIKAQIPVLPESTKTSDIEKAMLTYSDKINQQLRSVSVYQEMVASAWAARTEEMGEPIYSLARLLTLKNDGTQYSVPDNVRGAINDYSKQMVGIFSNLIEIEEELTALVRKFDFFKETLEGYYLGSRGGMENGAKLAIERALKNLKDGSLTASTLLNVVLATQKSSLQEDKSALDAISSTVAAVSGRNAISATQAESLNKAIWKLTQSVEKAEERTAEPDVTVPSGSGLGAL